MKSIPPTCRTLALLAALAASSLPLAAQNLPFGAFETEGITNLADLDFIELNALVFTDGDDIIIRISNDSEVGDGWVTTDTPTITSIHFNDPRGFLGNASIVGWVGDVALSRDDSARLPGGDHISFASDIAYLADPPPASNGIDPGESIDFRFEDTTTGDFLDSARIGLHVQQIGPDDESAGYVSVPETSFIFLCGPGLLLLIRRRRGTSPPPGGLE